MNILVVSDTHGSTSRIEWIKENSNLDYDACIHLGDSEGQAELIEKILGVPLYIVRGNCDLFVDLDDNMAIKIGRHNCLLTHGHLFGAKSSMNGLIIAAKEVGADCVFFGHTHRAQIIKEKDILLVNPGSLTYPRNALPSYIDCIVNDQGEMELELKYIE